MRKRLALLIMLISIPLLFLTALFMAQRSFSLSLNREKQRTQMTQNILYREILEKMEKMSYAQASQAARQYQYFYRAQGVRLFFTWNGQSIMGEPLPNPEYSQLLTKQRVALLDTTGNTEQYVIAEPIHSHLTMILIANFHDLYEMRSQYLYDSLIIAGFGAFLLGIFSMLLAGFFTKPVYRLTAAADEISRDPYNALTLPTMRNDEIGKLSKSFQNMQQAIQNREAALRNEVDARQELLDAMAHEMRTPLTSLLGNTRLLQRNIPEDARKEVLSNMSNEIKRLADMDSSLMKLTQLRHDELEKCRVSVLSLLQETKRRLSENDANVHITVSGDPSFLFGDPELLSILADNLANNAIHASAAGQEILLTSLPNGFSVQDHGRGMTEEEIQHACEAFWKADKSRTRAHGGTGLGLTLCHTIAALHQGTLQFESQLGIGTKVTFTTSLHPVDDSVTSPVRS